MNKNFSERLNKVKQCFGATDGRISKNDKFFVITCNSSRDPWYIYSSRMTENDANSDANELHNDDHDQYSSSRLIKVVENNDLSNYGIIEIK